MSPDALYWLLDDETKEIKQLRICNEEILEAVIVDAEEEHQKSDKINIFIAAFTTCHARLKLYDGLDTLKEQVLYYDTDSIIYRWRPGWSDIPTGVFLGQMRDETEGDPIVEFASGGAKNYGYKTRGGKFECKVRGFTLNVRGSAVLNFESLKNNILAELEDPQEEPRQLQLTNPNFFERDVTNKRIKLTQRVKNYKLVFDKRVIDVSTRKSYPYGYSRIGHEIDLLLDL